MYAVFNVKIFAFHVSDPFIFPSSIWPRHFGLRALGAIMDHQDGWTCYDDTNELCYDDQWARLFEQQESERLNSPVSQESDIERTESPQFHEDDVFTLITDVFTATAEVQQQLETGEETDRSQEVTDHPEVEAPAGKSDEKSDEHGYRWKRCPICDAWVNVGKTKTKDGALNQHKGSKPCQANVRKRDAAAAQAALLKIFPPIALPQPPSQQATPSIWSTHTSLADLQASASSSYSLPEPPLFWSSHSYTGIQSLESPLPGRVIATNSTCMSTIHQWLGSDTNETAPASMAPVFNNAFSPSFLSMPSSSAQLSRSVASSTASPGRTLLNESEDQTCSGIILDWTVGDVYTTYPMQLHSLAPQTLNYHFSYLDPKGVACRITSDTCTRNRLPNGMACLPCQRLAPVVKNLHDRALKLNPTTNNIYANFIQMRERLDGKGATIRQLKLDVRIF